MKFNNRKRYFNLDQSELLNEYNNFLNKYNVLKYSYESPHPKNNENNINFYKSLFYIF